MTKEKRNKKEISIHALPTKFQNIVKLSQKLEKIPRQFGTDVTLTNTEIHLVELIGETENLSVTDIAKLQEVTKGAVSQSLKRLESKGLTGKTEDPENISRSIITLTNKGKTAYYAHKHWHETRDGGMKEYFNSLDREKIEFLSEFLDKIEHFMKQRILTEK